MLHLERISIQLENNVEVIECIGNLGFLFFYLF